MKKSTRPSLPLMGMPFEGIELLLNLVAQYTPSPVEMDELVKQRRHGDLQRLSYYSGQEDILYFCLKQLNLIKLEDGRFHLAEAGTELYRHLFTPEFGRRLFKHLVNCSKEGFTYFYDVYEALESRARRGEYELQIPTFQNLLLEKSNKRSSKEIYRLLLGCGAIDQYENSIEIDPSLFLINIKQSQLEQLWSEVPELIRMQGRLSYDELVFQLKELYPSFDWDTIENEFKFNLITTKTRAAEYVDGVRQVKRRL